MKGSHVNQDNADASEPGLLEERAGGVVRLTFNRPHARNAIDWPVRHLLVDALERAAEPGVRAVVIAGDATSFSAGADISELAVGSDDTADKLATARRTIELIASIPAPVIAAVQGHAAGAGFGIALACDLVLAAESAIFHPSFARIGISTDFGVSYWLPRIVGPQRAKGILFGGGSIPARRALELGLVSEVWPVDEFDARVEERVAALAEGPTLAFAAMKRLVNQSPERTMLEQLDAEIADQLNLVASADHGEGLTSFAERRPPRFEGR